MVAVGRRLTDAAAGRFGLAYDNVKLYFHAPWLFGFGGGIFAAGGKLAVDTPQARRALAFAASLGRVGGIVPPESTTFSPGAP